MNWIEAIVLGIIQGLTEFLPVSSSGHLEISKALFGIDPGASFYFTVAVHGATVLSTIVVFRNELLKLLKGALKFSNNEETSYLLKLLISMIPVGITGLFLKDKVEALFNGNMIFIGSMLIITASLLALAHFTRRGDRPVGWIDALVIGLAQAIAVIPGISRSGATIATGLIIGNRKEDLARFSFLMVLIPVLGANFLEIAGSDAVADSTGTMSIIIGSLAAFVSGYFACKWMIALVRRSKLIWFSLYCLAAGLLSILFI
jgi:undecaprenyl-diphosphatase